MNDTNIILSAMNSLYWFKDQVENEEDYLKTLMKLSIGLELEGLTQEITEYLDILKLDK